MEKTLTLTNAVMIDGVSVDKLKYDTDKITAPLFARAEAAKKQAMGIGNVSMTPMAEFDFTLHLYLGFAAIIGCNPQVDFIDLERIHGRDTMEIMAIGRNFILQSEESITSNSDDVIEITPGLSTQA